MPSPRHDGTLHTEHQNPKNIAELLLWKFSDSGSMSHCIRIHNLDPEKIKEFLHKI